MKKLSYLSFALVALGLCLLAAQDVWGQGQNFPGSGGTGAGVSSLSGDANIFCNSSGTGAVTLTDCTPVNLPSGATLNATPFASGATANISNYCPLAGCTFTGALSGTSWTGSGTIALTNDGVHAGSVQIGGNTTEPTVSSNVAGFIGPNSASFTSWLCQFPSAAPSGGQVLSCGTPSSGISTGTWASLSGATGSTTEGLDGFWNNGWPANALLGTQLTTGISVLGTGYVQLIVPSHNTYVGHASVYVSTGQASGVFYACIYTSTSSAAVWSANVAVATSTVAATASAAQYEMLAGTPYYVLTGQFGSATGATFETWLNTIANAGTILNAQGTYTSTSANGLSGAACPSTLGTLTSITSGITVFPTVLLGP